MFGKGRIFGGAAMGYAARIGAGRFPGMSSRAISDHAAGAGASTGGADIGAADTSGQWQNSYVRRGRGPGAGIRLTPRCFWIITLLKPLVFLNLVFTCNLQFPPGEAKLGLPKARRGASFRSGFPGVFRDEVYIPGDAPKL
ncbi:hypothetical protein HGM15179_020557 [Zosterops borbonicus]|uniref:Uncharacterized protein n=1 Tax=Zosterops borbonicus TaxID=364589 RepID=A0A8K1FXJ9_9PASS|nr:hypothetical protein HGM15179_020557 [Zosterops borbonicus]